MSGGSETSAFWREHDAVLRELAALGLTTTEAGRRLGVSKNAVIGRGYRIGVLWARRPKRMRDGTPPKPIADFPPPGGCVYPHGHPGEADFRFCGKRVERAGLPYCPGHMAIAYQPARPEQEAA